jgi:hypothetical protein
MCKLIPLRAVPYKARVEEAQARKTSLSRAEALAKAEYQITMASGTYSAPYPPTVGWVCTLAAAEALAAEITRMPGDTYHHSLAFSRRKGG